MKRRFTEEQIIAILREQEAVGRVKDITRRRHGISEQSFYRWKAKYGGLEVSEAGRLRELAAERRRFGYRRLHAHLRREGWRVNHKAVHRMYVEEGL